MKTIKNLNEIIDTGENYLLEKVDIDIIENINLKKSTLSIKNCKINIIKNATINNVYDNATINNVYDNATINNVSDNATISYVFGNATISYVYGNATISYVYGNAKIIEIKSKKVVVRATTKKYISKSIKNYVFVKIETNKNINWYLKNYPITKKDKDTLILYKSVHKINNEYISDKNSNFKYEIGKFKTEKLAPKKDGCCASGIHISHLFWAKKFGKSWSDCAILECEVKIKDIVVGNDCDGKVRASKIKVIREYKE
jgi:hypothetical protein